MTRHLKIAIASLLLATGMIAASAATSRPDFNYPKTVSAQAEADLNKALRSADGEKTVDALVRYSIANSLISSDNIGYIMSRIDSVKRIETRPQYKSLLCYFEALVLNNYSQNNALPTKEAEGARPTDYSEWTEKQFNTVIDSLILESVANESTLKSHGLEEFSTVIDNNTAKSRIYCPTLLDFLLQQCTNLSNGSNLKKTLLSRIIANNEPGSAPYIEASLDNGCDALKLYEANKSSEYSALALQKCNGSDATTYNALQEYTRLHPKSQFVNGIKNQITTIETQDVKVSYATDLSPLDSVRVAVVLKNRKDFSLRLYGIPDGTQMQGFQYETSKLKLLSTTNHSGHGGNIPYTDTVTVALPPLAYGEYLIAPVFDNAGKTVERTRLDASCKLRVHTITMISAGGSDGKNTVITADINTGEPIKGVTVSGKGFSGVTGADGTVSVPKTMSYALKASLGNDKYAPQFYCNNYYGSDGTANSAKIVTDLAIYRPGEKVNYSAVVYTTAQDERQPVANQKVAVSFRDTNGKQIDADSPKVTDAYGRIEGQFTVPTDRMNGRYSIRMNYGPQNWAYAYIQVSEYKAPTYSVAFTNVKSSYNKGVPVSIKGKATTYTDVPVANAQVKVKLYSNEWSWWSKCDNQGDLVTDTIVSTDDNGEFAVEYAPSNFKNTNSGNCRRWYLGCSYYVEATCTDAAGETQTTGANFIIGNKRSVSLTGTTRDFIAGKATKLPVIYNSTTEGDTHAQCTYKLTSTSSHKVVATGNFDSANPVVDFSNVPSGEYSITLAVLADTMAEPSTADITLFRTTDKKAPVANSQLWTADALNSVDATDVAHITIGTSVPESNIFYVAVDRTGEVSRGWLKYKPGLHGLKIKIPAKENNELRVYLISAHHRTIGEKTLTFKSNLSEHSLKLVTTSFRDRITPGSTEKWTFSLVDNKGKAVQGAMMLEVIDKAVNSLRPNTWAFSPNYTRAYRFSFSHSNLDNQQENSVSWCGSMLNYSGNHQTPSFNVYTQYLFSGGTYRVSYNRRLGATMLMAKTSARVDYRMSNASADRMAMNEDDATEESANAAPKAAAAANEQLNQVTVRESQVKTALWRPMLVSDAKGNVSVDFEVPSQNTTWLMQAIAYDKTLASAVSNSEIVAQKTIMVKPSVPRFIRQADVATLTANVQNAGTESAKTTAKVEIFDPRTGNVISEHTVERTIAAQATDTVAITFTVPAEMPYAGFRIRATDGMHTDGEQCLLPVLASQSPVIETTPFYIDAAKSQFSMQLPSFNQGSRVTIEYCDNPVWYCVTALPTIYNGGQTKIATRIAHDLFAAGVAQGTVKSYPELAEAIKHWNNSGNADSTLTSMLERNADLKIGTLLASPWINDAERQTLRMSRISELIDEQKSAAAITSLVDALASVQMGDGGFTWFRYPGCKSSVWTTGTVLELIGETQKLGYLTDNSKLNSIVKRALQYYDYKMLEAFKEQTKKNSKNHTGFSTYAYVRSLYSDAKLGTENSEMMQKVLKSLTSEWKGAAIPTKACIAMTLYRNGYKAESSRIAESIRQFAITKESTGMYWDNIDGSGWYHPDKVATTAVILRALNEVDHRTAEIDQVRKWMLLMKQSNDWGSSSLAADAVQALLSTGSKWTGKSEATVTVDRNTVGERNVDPYLGYGRVTLDASASGKLLAVDRSTAGPAWGAVYAQYQAPMTEIKAYKTNDIEVTKQYLKYGESDKLIPTTTLKVGDKVQVRTIIKLAKDADFITLTDERAACLEPADQTSGYRCDNGAWYYLETKDAQTNAFFESLSKGTHVVSYDAYVTAQGTYSTGIATAQCQYAPQITAHSAGGTITVTSAK